MALVPARKAPRSHENSAIEGAVRSLGSPSSPDGRKRNIALFTPGDILEMPLVIVVTSVKVPTGAAASLHSCIFIYFRREIDAQHLLVRYIISHYRLTPQQKHVSK